MSIDTAVDTEQTVRRETPMSETRIDTRLLGETDLDAVVGGHRGSGGT